MAKFTTNATDPGCWVYDLNDISDRNQFEIVSAEKFIQATDSIPWFLVRKVCNYHFDMFPSWSHCFIGFRTVFVFALGRFLPMLVFFWLQWELLRENRPKNIFCDFPIVIPIVIKKITSMGRQRPRAKTKTVLKLVKQWDQHGNMQNWISKIFLNKNHPTSIWVM